MLKKCHSKARYLHGLLQDRWLVTLAGKVLRLYGSRDCESPFDESIAGAPGARYVLA
jgi:hypothetical protein